MSSVAFILKFVLIWQMLYIGLPGESVLAMSAATMTQCQCCLPDVGGASDSHHAQTTGEQSCCVIPPEYDDATPASGKPATENPCQGCENCNCGCLPATSPTLMVLHTQVGQLSPFASMTGQVNGCIVTRSLEPTSPPPRICFPTL